MVFCKKRRMPGEEPKRRTKRQKYELLSPQNTSVLTPSRTTSGKQKMCPLMDLPAELRNTIYEYALAGDEVVHIHSKRCRHLGRRRPKPWREPGLLRASKVIRSETLLLYYDTRGFEIHITASDCMQFSRWQDWLGEQCGSRPVKAAQVHVWGGSQWREILTWIALARFIYNATGEDLQYWAEIGRAHV